MTTAATIFVEAGIAMAGADSIVEFESKVSHSQQETIVTQLNRQGVITEVIPLEGHHE